MDSPEQIEEISESRIEEAKILCDNEKYDAAFYLAGYSVELALKAKICRKIGVPNLFSIGESNQDRNSVKDGIPIFDIRKALKTHDLYFLLVIGGFKKKFDEDKAKNQSLFRANSLLFANWNEKCRYKPCGYMKREDVKNLINLLTEDNGLLQWIKEN